MEYKINHQERAALQGLPYLQQLVYLLGLRPYMDYATGIVGIKRGISYQSLAEELYVEPHQGYLGGSPSKNQIRRALAKLINLGVLKSKNCNKKLVFECVLASRDKYAQNKVGTKPTHQLDTSSNENACDFSRHCEEQPEKAGTPKIAKVDTPPVSGIHIIFLQQSFEIFWQTYPQKKARQKTWEIYCRLNPSQELFEKIKKGLEGQIDFYQQQKILGRWVPAWKYPANWLAQQCWQDEINHDDQGDYSHAKNSNKDILWESCKAGIKHASENANVIQHDFNRK